MKVDNVTNKCCMVKVFLCTCLSLQCRYISINIKKNTWVAVHSVISYHFFCLLGGGSLTYLSVELCFRSGVSNRILDYFLQVQFNFYKNNGMDELSHSARVMDVVQAF